MALINQLEKCPQALNLIFDEEASIRHAAALTLEHCNQRRRSQPKASHFACK